MPGEYSCRLPATKADRQHAKRQLIKSMRAKLSFAEFDAWYAKHG